MGGPARTRRLLVLLTHKGDKVVERLLRESLVENMWQVYDKDEKVTNMTRWQGSSTSKSRVGSMWGWFVLKLLIMICRYDLYHSVIAISSWKYPPQYWGMNYDRAEDGFATISNSCLARWAAAALDIWNSTLFSGIRWCLVNNDHYDNLDHDYAHHDNNDLAIDKKAPVRSRGTLGGWAPWRGSERWWCGPRGESSTGAGGADLQIQNSPCGKCKQYIWTILSASTYRYKICLFGYKC